MATINVEIPNDKVDNLVAMFKARYNVTDELTKQQDKLDFLGKILSHETVQIVRQAIIESAQAQAQQAIKSDSGIAKTTFEAELEAKAMNVGPTEVANLIPKGVVAEEAPQQ